VGRLHLFSVIYSLVGCRPALLFRSHGGTPWWVAGVGVAGVGLAIREHPRWRHDPASPIRDSRPQPGLVVPRRSSFRRRSWARGWILQQSVSARAQQSNASRWPISPFRTSLDRWRTRVNAGSWLLLGHRRPRREDCQLLRKNASRDRNI